MKNYLFGRRFSNNAEKTVIKNGSRKVTILSADKTLKSSFKTIERVNGRIKSEEFWDARGKFYGAIFSRA